MKILITGATGFIGKSIVKGMNKQGHEIFIIKRKSSDTSTLREFISKEWIIDSTTENFDFVFERDQYDVVIHLATHFLSDHKASDIGSLLEANLGFGIKLLDSMSKSSSRNLLNFNSSWQRFSDNDPSPVNLYAALKDGFCRVLDFYSSAYGIKFLNLRIYDTYGLGDKRKKLIPLLIRCFKKDSPLEMTPGEQYIDIIHIEDIICAVNESIKLMMNGVTGIEYAIASKTPIKVKDLVKILEHLTGKKNIVTLGGREYRVREVMYPDYPSSILPGWIPKINIEQGLKELLEDKSAD